MNFAPTESIFRHSKSLIVLAFEKLSTGKRYFLHVWVNCPLLNTVSSGGIRKQLALPVPGEEHIHCTAYGTAQYFGFHSVYHA